MIETTEEFETRLNNLDPDHYAFVLRTDELVGALAPPIADKVYISILRFFERYPNADCGAPGTLVHHMEDFYPNYVDALIDSVQSKPSFNGVLMVNRILNSDIDAALRSRLIAALKSVDAKAFIAPHVVEMVQRFIERHS